jgi:hypothetical protein
MPSLPATKTCLVAIAAGCATLAASLPAQASALDALRDHQPGLETAGPADAGFATACRASARERLGREQLTFDRPTFTVLDGRQIVRMDLSEPGERRDPDRIFRAVCVRDAANQAVDAMVFDAPADGVGPRVVALAGPTPEMRPRKPPPEVQPSSNVVVIPSQDGGYGYPGLWVPGSSWDDRRGWGDRRGDNFDRRSRKVLETSRGNGARFIAPRSKSNSMRFGSRATTRMGTGGFVR